MSILNASTVYSFYLNHRDPSQAAECLGIIECTVMKHNPRVPLVNIKDLMLKWLLVTCVSMYRIDMYNNNDMFT